MYISIDVKLTSNDLNAQCLALCLCDENNNKFYAEFIDYYPFKLTTEDKEYISDKLKYIRYEDSVDYWDNLGTNEYDNIVYDNENGMHITGTQVFISKKLFKWLSTYQDIIFVTDYNFLGVSYVIDLLKRYNNVENLYISKGIVDINNIIAYATKMNVDKSLFVDRFDILEKSNVIISRNTTCISNAINTMSIFSIIRYGD